MARGAPGGSYCLTGGCSSPSVVPRNCAAAGPCGSPAAAVKRLGAADPTHACSREREGCWSHGIRVFTSTGVRWTGVASERSDVAPSAASAASAVLARVFTTAVASLHIVESTGGHCVCVFSHRIFAFSRFFSWELRCCSELVRSGQSPIWDRAPSFLSA